MTHRRPGIRVCRHASSLDLHVVSAVHVNQMAPEGAALKSACHTEVPTRTGGQVDPSAARDEVTAVADGLTLARNFRVRRRDHHVRNSIDDYMEGIDGDVTVVRGTAALLVNHDSPGSSRQLYSLVWFSFNCDRLSVDDEPHDLRTSTDSRTTHRLCSGHQELGTDGVA